MAIEHKAQIQGILKLVALKICHYVLKSKTMLFFQTKKKL